MDLSENAFSKPSIFEIVAHESVAGMLRPAFHYILQIFVKKYPEKLGILWKYVDEIYMVCDGVLQRHYMNFYNGSLSENFYYLKRISTYKGQPLTPSLIKLSLFSLVVLPYIKTKLDYLFESYRDKLVRGQDSPDQQMFMICFLKIYPYVYFTLQCPFALYQLGYTLNLLTYHNPIFHALKIQLVRASSGDLLGIDPVLYLTSDSILKKLAFLPVFLIDKLIKCIAMVMPTIIFLLQFLEWWYSTEHEMTTHITSLPVPPPPKSPKVSENGCGLPLHPLQCPLCHKVSTNMAALVSSGFVFCYPCIHQYVMEHGLCPVTQISSNMDQILRIYSLQGT